MASLSTFYSSRCKAAIRRLCAFDLGEAQFRAYGLRLSLSVLDIVSIELGAYA
jgi:hypothetical protein